jgi:hypothetical protein
VDFITDRDCCLLVIGVSISHQPQAGEEGRRTAESSIQNTKVGTSVFFLHHASYDVVA